MKKLVQAIGTIISDNPLMLGVSLLGSISGIAWSLIVGFAILGLYVNNREAIQESTSGVHYALYFVCAFVLIWGSQVAYNICHVVYCGVFGRWYCRQDESTRLRKSLAAAFTTSLGSICFGSLVIAMVRALEFMVRQMRRDQQGEGNMVACILLLILECVIACIGDIMEYFSEWAYVQVAVRGVSFYNAVKITYSMCSCANLIFILQDLLLDSVVTFGALLCGAAGALVSGGAGYALGSATKAAVCTIIGLWAGLVAGGSCVGMFSSGVKTILALWAESPDTLQQTHPEIHCEFAEKIKRGFQE